MKFNRPPRIPLVIDKEKIRILPPKALPSKPKINWITVGLPIFAIGASIGLMSMFSETGSRRNYWFFLPLMIASVLGSIITYFIEKNQYKKTVESQEDQYHNYLAEKEKELRKICRQQTKKFQQRDPSVVECNSLADDMSSRLGERRPNDEDFLRFRVGAGKRSSEIVITLPEENELEDEIIEGVREQWEDIEERFSLLNDVPVLADFKESGNIGVCGSKTTVISVARACVMHLSTHHWPSEVNMLVFCGTTDQERDWEYIKKLPHIGAAGIFSSVYVDPQSDEFKSVSKNIENEINHRKSVRGLDTGASSGEKDGKVTHLPAIVIILDHIDQVYKIPAFVMSLKEGRSLDIYCLVLKEQFQELPGECDCVLDFSENPKTIKKTSGQNIVTTITSPDLVSASEAIRHVKSLSKIDWLIPEDVSEPPSQLSLLEMFEVDHVRDLDIEYWWDNGSPYGYLRAPLGKLTPTNDLIFDLNEDSSEGETHGPHGIIGGTTGSGKSEALRTLILSLAVTHHPYDINFALVDYKGGGAFRDLENLPHVVGLITDIENHSDYARRVILALTGEVKSRKRILQEAQIRAGIKHQHIDDYRELTVKRPLPRLIIIFDEYAEFQDQHPEEAKKLNKIARQGRSLGIHLILCTQNPASVTDKQVQQNLKFRLCLRVSEQQDSRELIGIPDAWLLPTGYAYMKVKHPQKLKLAYTGGNSIKGEMSTEATRIVEKIIETYQKAKLNSPPNVWPEPLSERIFLPDLFAKILEHNGLKTRWNGETWEDSGSLYLSNPVLGLYDDPENQAQPEYYLGSGSKLTKNLLVFGGSGTGKTSFLSTLIMSLAYTFTPDQVNVYGIDLGGSNLLRELSHLPHFAVTGGILVEKESEKIFRLLSMLRSEIDVRNELFFTLGCNGYEHYSELFQENPNLTVLPEIYVFVDSLFTRYWKSVLGFKEELLEIVLRGHDVGINVIITANTDGDVDLRIKSNITDKIVLCPSRKIDTTNIIDNVPNHFFLQDSESNFPQGRGLWNRKPITELQFALPVQGKDDVEIQFNLNNVVKKMASDWCGARPKNVEKLHDWIHIHEVMDKFSKKNELKDTFYFPLGLSHGSLQPVGESIGLDSPVFTISSEAPGQGLSTTLTVWLLQAMKYGPKNTQYILIDFHNVNRELRYFSEIPNVTYCGVKGQVDEVISDLETQTESRQTEYDDAFCTDQNNLLLEKFVRDRGYIVVVVDNYSSLVQKDSKLVTRIFKCLNENAGEELGLKIICTEKQLNKLKTIDGLAIKTKANGTGIVLGGSKNLPYYNGAKPPLEIDKADLYPGRGYIINKGKPVFGQIAIFHKQDESFVHALQREIELITKA